MKSFVSRSAYCLRLFLIFALLLPVTAEAKPKTDPNAKIRAALAAAQTIYLQEADGTGTADFLLFQAGLRALGRYQLLNTTLGADLILRYEAPDDGLNPRRITFLDSKTLQPLGALSKSGGMLNKSANMAKSAAGLLAQITQFVGDSKPAQPIPAQPSPSTTPGLLTSTQQAASLLQAAHSVFVVELSDFCPGPKHTTCQLGELLGLLKSDLTGWGRYQLVDSLAAADLVVEMYGDYYLANQTTEFARFGTKVVGDSTPELNLTVLDAKTLAHLGGTSVDLNTDASLHAPDPKGATIQALVDSLKKIIDSPTTK